MGRKTTDPAVASRPVEEKSPFFPSLLSPFFLSFSLQVASFVFRRKKKRQINKPIQAVGPSPKDGWRYQGPRMVNEIFPNYS